LVSMKQVRLIKMGRIREQLDVAIY